MNKGELLKINKKTKRQKDKKTKRQKDKKTKRQKDKKSQVATITNLLKKPPSETS